jgi:argininosuccinate lyase
MGKTLWEKNGKTDSGDDLVEAFTVGNDHLIDRSILADDCWASIAHAAALARAGILNAEELALLQQSLLSLIDRDEREGVDIARAQEDCHTTIETALTEELGDLGKKIHTGRSRNDQVLTAIRLFTKRRMLDVCGEIVAVAHQLLERAQGGVRMPMRGYSHTRPAMPTTVAVWLGSYVELLLNDAAVVGAAFDLNDRSPLGSAAGFGTTIPLDREFTRLLLGFGGLQVNALSCQTSRGKVEGTIVHALQCVQETLDTLARDVILYSTDEFGFLSIPNELTTGSKTGVMTGAASQLRAVGSGLTSGYHRDYQLLKEPLITALDAVESCLQIMARVVSEVDFNEAVMKASCTKEIYAAEIASEKAQQGTPFRDAYRQAMADLAGLTVDDSFIESRIDAYKTLGSMGNPGLGRYEEPLAELSAWLKKQRAQMLETRARLREPISF